MATNSSISKASGGEGLIADLAVISYEKLLQKDAGEASLLISACIDFGFFYLSLGGSGSKTYQETVKNMFKMSKEYFAKPLEEKLKDTNEDFSVFNICG